MSELSEFELELLSTARDELQPTDDDRGRIGSKLSLALGGGAVGLCSISEAVASVKAGSSAGALATSSSAAAAGGLAAVGAPSVVAGTSFAFGLSAGKIILVGTLGGLGLGGAYAALPAEVNEPSQVHVVPAVTARPAVEKPRSLEAATPLTRESKQGVLDDTLSVKVSAPTLMGATLRRPSSSSSTTATATATATAQGGNRTELAGGTNRTLSVVSARSRTDRGVGPRSDVLQEVHGARAVGTQGERSAPAAVAQAGVNLSEELTLLSKARRVLSQGDGAGTLALLRKLNQNHPQGMLIEERRATQVLAHCALGQVAEARRQARLFSKRWQSSVYTDRIQGSCVARGLAEVELPTQKKEEN